MAIHSLSVLTMFFQGRLPIPRSLSNPL